MPDSDRNESKRKTASDPPPPVHALCSSAALNSAPARSTLGTLHAHTASKTPGACLAHRFRIVAAGPDLSRLREGGRMTAWRYAEPMTGSGMRPLDLTCGEQSKLRTAQAFKLAERDKSMSEQTIELHAGTRPLERILGGGYPRRGDFAPVSL
jgi:hypothetical protein